MLSTQNLVINSIDIWTSSVEQRSAAGRGQNKKISLHGIQKIRELILELALRGALVPQDANDTPVSDLLEKVEVEKALLIKEGTIKKLQPFLEVTEKEKVFDLPQGWQWVRLGEVGNIFSGNSINARLKKEKYSGVDGIPFIATKDVKYGFEDLNYDSGVAIPVGDPKFKVANKGAVLVCAEGGSAGKKCGIAHQQICFGNKLFANELFGEISPAFVLTIYLSPTFYKLFAASMTGIIGGISKAKFANLQIPLPPLQEQIRIVSKVNELMAICDQLEKNTEDNILAHRLLVTSLLKTLTQSKNLKELLKNWNLISDYFDSLFITEESINQLGQTILQLAILGKLVPQDSNDEPASELLMKIEANKTQLVKQGVIKRQKAVLKVSEEEKSIDLPVGWSWAKCQDICHKITDGEHATPKRTVDGFYLLSARNVTNEGILLEDVDFVGADEFERIRSRCDPNIGDILISCSGSIGRVAIVDADDKYSMVRSAAMIRPDENVLTSYVAYCLRSPFLQEQMKLKSKGTAQDNLFLGPISNLVLPIPPLSEQVRIVSKVDELMKVCNELKELIFIARSIQNDIATTIVKKVLA